MRTAAIFTPVVNFCWALFKCCLFLVVVAAIGAGVYLYFRLDNEIRRQVEQRLALHYRDFQVTVGGARFDQDRGIAVFDVSLTHKSQSNGAPIVAIDEMYLAGNVQMEDLLTSKLQIEEIVVRRAKLDALCELDGQWNLKALLPLPNFSHTSPRITVENAALAVRDASHGLSKPWVIDGINLKIAVAEPGTSNSGIAARRLHVEGTATGLPARSMQIVGEITPEDREFNLNTSIVGLEVSSDVLAKLPGCMTEQLSSVQLSGRADIVMQISRTAASQALDWTASVKVDRGQCGHPTLPEPLTDIAFDARADRQGIFIERLDAKYGAAKVLLAVQRSGWSASAKFAANMRITGLQLDDRLQANIPASCARPWKRFQPKGPVDAAIQLTYDGKQFQPIVTAECRGISLTDMEKFPYPLQQVTGHIEYRPAASGQADQLRLNLVGVGGGRPVRIDADLSHLTPPESEGITTGSGLAEENQNGLDSMRSVGYRGIRSTRLRHSPPAHPVGWVAISGSDIPIHEELLTALRDDCEAFARSMHPQGTIDFGFRAEWKDLKQQKAEVTQEIRFKDCRAQYERFPYPLNHVQGVATANNGNWTIHDFEGRGINDSTVVRCRGKTASQADGCRADLMIEVANVPLDESLKLALSPSSQQAWDELQPQGRIDFNTHVVREIGQREPLIEVVMRPRDRSVSIEPRFFPYRLDRIEGIATSRLGKVALHNVVAHHERAEISASSGTWQRTADGGWQFALAGIHADRLSAERELISALPPALQSTIARLQPSGTFDLNNSSVSVSKSSQLAGINSAWDINLECQQASITTGMPLRGVTGGVRLVGRNEGSSFYTGGEVSLDSVLCNDVQLTNVHGPLWIDSSLCLLGEPAATRQGQSPRRATADAYGGSLAANLEIQHASGPAYKMDIHLGAADLKRFANERLGGPNDMSGTVSGKLLLAGVGPTKATLTGSGELHVVDGNIYQLPPLVAMLKVLRNREPDTAAFNRCDMEFTIQGEHVHFQHLNLLGDAVSLYGKGETGFDRRLNLVFYTLIGPADLPIPIVRTIVGHVSQQGLQLKVVGTFEHPDIEREPFPAVNEMLQQLQYGLQEGAATMAPSTAARGIKPAAR